MTSPKFQDLMKACCSVHSHFHALHPLKDAGEIETCWYPSLQWRISQSVNHIILIMEWMATRTSLNQQIFGGFSFQNIFSWIERSILSSSLFSCVKKAAQEDSLGMVLAKKRARKYLGKLLHEFLLSFFLSDSNCLCSQLLKWWIMLMQHDLISLSSAGRNEWINRRMTDTVWMDDR